MACNISSILCIGLGTVGKILKQFKVTGDIGPSSESQCQERRHVHFLDDTHELFIIGLVLEQPTSQVKEICSKIENATFVKVSPATVCRLLHRFGMTLKKVCFVAAQHSANLRGHFMAEMLHFQQHTLVWLDENESDGRNFFSDMVMQLEEIEQRRIVLIQRTAYQCHSGDIM